MPVQATAVLIVMVKLALVSCVGLSESVTVTEKVGVVLPWPAPCPRALRSRGQWRARTDCR